MSGDANASIVVVGMACRVPGADNVEAFADLLFSSRTGYSELPSDRCDRSLYFDSQKGKAGKSYTTLGGTVPERPLNRDLCPLSENAERLFDTAHVQFAEVAATAWRNAELVPQDARLSRTGVYVGHSGGTKSGGRLSLGTQIEEALSFVDDIESFRQLPPNVRREIITEVSAAIRRDRPSRQPGALPSFHAYQAASLSARILGLTGPRAVIDAACASSLVALAQAMLAIKAGRIDSAIVGGATYNNIDNLILFSHSQACTATDSRPFDDHASGLVSSEGYVAIVIMTQATAIEHDLPILGVIRGVGMASDGKGRSLWAPRMEGQVLALQRAYGDDAPLDIDYMEAHATSTQLGDATELETLRRLSQHPKSQMGRHQLLLGSVKSNIGHTLEAAGLIGMVKVLTAMQRRQIPPSLRYEQPNRNYDWETAPVRVVSRTEPWPEHALHSRPRRAAVSAFGIGGLNAHVVVEEAGTGGASMESDAFASRPVNGSAPTESEPIAIIGRGIIVAGAKNLQEFKSLLESNRSALSDAPDNRWRKRAGVSDSPTSVTHHTPHCHGGFVTDFNFNGSKYAIPPKQVQQANPVQLMLIDAVTQALADVNSESTRQAEDVNPLVTRGASEKGSDPLRQDDLPPKGQTPFRSPEKFPFDRQRIGVVVGTIFGGEFGDQLQVGMRLPEICQEITTSLQRRGLPNQLSQQITTEFRQIVLKNRPALLDETGSFTASTLASRIAKSFDLMGGACALDSDDTSGLTALSVAADQLRSGTSDMIVCGSAQRSMSLSAFEALDMNGQLVRSGRPEDVPDDCHQILPGEGVVALMLCRLSDARRLDLPIYGILGDVVQRNMSVARGSSPAQIRTALEVRSTDVLTSADARIIRKIGYLAGAHSLVRIAAETILGSDSGQAGNVNPDADVMGWPSGTNRTFTIAAQTTDGVILHAPLLIPFANAIAEIQKQPEPFVYASPMTQQVSFPMTTEPLRANVTSDSPLQCIRFAAASGTTLLQLLKNAVARPEQFTGVSNVIREASDPVGRVSRPVQIRTGLESRPTKENLEFTFEDQFRATILFASVEQLQQRLAAAIKAAEAGKFNTLLDRERVILWKTSQESPRVAWLFPGQGSHYSETPSVLSACEIARQTLAEVDDLYAASNLPRLSTAFNNATIKPGVDVWWAQAWVLGVSASLIRTLRSQGLHPDAVLGHSFGEFTASLAAGVTTLPQTIALAKHRANAVISHMRVPGGLLSIRAAVHEVDAIMKPAGLDVYVTHLNSTKQTVIAGSREGIASAKVLLDKSGLASMSVSVPAPFHTPLLADAEVAFEQLSSSVTMRPPVCGFLSATCVQYLAEPSSIRRSLVRQLTQPVMFMPSIQRMMGEGYQVFLEVGPNDVLTRMNRDIVDDSALCLSLDVPGQPFAERMQLVHAVLECVTSVTRRPVAANASTTDTAASAVASRNQTTNPASVAVAEETVFDVTRLRRGNRKTLPQLEETSVQNPDWTRPLNGHDPSAESAPLRLSDPFSTQRPVASFNAANVSVTSSSSKLSDEHLRSFVLDLVIELTGYSPDVIDFDADLEAHLGIDSIKKAQILGELGVWLGMTVRPDGMRFDSVRTLDDAIRTVRKLAEEEAAPGQAVPSMLPVSPTRDAISGPTLPSNDRRGSLPPNAQLDALLMDYVIDQTGYTPDIVDLDADLEADLGLDSIKLAQLIGQMREQFSLEGLTLESIGQHRFRTLREIREFLVRHAGNEDVADSTSVAVGRDSRPVQTQTNHDRTAVPSYATSSYDTPNTDQAPRGIKPLRNITPEWSGWFGSGIVRSTSVDAALRNGIQEGQQHGAEIRAALRTLVNQQTKPNTIRDWSPAESAQLAGLAAGAGVAEASVRFAASVVRDHLQPAPPETISAPDKSVARTMPEVISTKSVSSQKTQRFALRVVPAPRRAGMPLNPKLHGAALILGANPLAEALAERIRELGQTAIVINTAVPIAQLEKSLADLWQQTATPHLFLTMAFDANSAKEISEAHWQHRRPAALEAPFRICQLWMQRTIDADQMENASVIAATQLGGDFGFSGQHVGSVEAIGGLVKAMLIEAWMRGFRTTPMKVIDLATNIPPHVATSGILQELAVPSYDMEIAFRGTKNAERLGVQAAPAPLSDTSQQRPVNRITRGGTWVVSGGGRGITAVIAMTLAKKYDLKLHLLGTAPVPDLSDEFVARVATDRSAVRNAVMQQSQSRGESPVEGWRKVEKAIEVDATLRDCRRQGITATYHSCDVSDFSEVAPVIQRIRQQTGPIAGVLHGAGAGQDSRFDRKRPDKVEKCLRAKIDGTIALMQATQSDPLEWFVTFGSISGRFGANGHTDYSLANDMMAKLVDRYRSQRPDVRSLTFHWHAWGDIGMATKPEAKLALEMIDMEFMPARDGIAHFMHELEFGGDEPEVLITDESYFRKFFPAERISVTSSSGSLPLPLLPSTVTQHGNGVYSSVVTLNPVTDKFLSQHRVQNRPTLPFVVALELMAEAVRARTGQPKAGICTAAVAQQAIRFATDDPLAVTVQTRSTSEGKIECRLLADVRRRDGRMVEEDREYFRATFEPTASRLETQSSPDFDQHQGEKLCWKRIQYASPEGLIYHGPELQELREVADDGRTIYGKIAASAPVQLFGGSRAQGYSIPCATMDACLYAIGYAAWHRHQKPSLPVQFGRIEFGRLPDPGEPCVVRIQEKQTLASGAILDFQLYGNNGDRLLTVCNYQIGWLKGS